MADPVDIYDRLREQAQVSPRVREKDSLMLEAADTIASLRENLREEQERGDAWRVKFNADTDIITERVAERDAALARVASLEAGLDNRRGGDGHSRAMADVIDAALASLTEEGEQ